MSETVAAKFQALREPFPPDQVEKLPKVLRKDDQDRGRCEKGSKYSADGYYCGGYHARAIHLDYIGHAGVTMRLNDVDPAWTWEPMATTDGGTPLFADGGLWIRLQILGVTRIGFGDAPGKTGGNAVKEAIGDAIRNAAMRFGVGTYLWSKSEAAQVIAAGGDPDADQAPQRTRKPPQDENPADVARAQLLEFCRANGLDPQRVAADYATEHGHTLREASAEDVQALLASLSESVRA